MLLNSSPAIVLVLASQLFRGIPNLFIEYFLLNIQFSFVIPYSAVSDRGYRVAFPIPRSATAATGLVFPIP
jgi:hypothetical protein